MKIILTTGGRTYDNFVVINSALEYEAPDLIIVGDATGADELVLQWARTRKIPYLLCPADWSKYDKSAGPIRNVLMCSIAKSLERDGHAVKVIAFPGGEGTKHCVETAKYFFLTVKLVV